MPASTLKPMEGRLRTRCGACQRDSKLISVNVHRYATEIASFLVDPGELIRIYNQENLCRSAVQGTISGDFVHIEFILRKFRFVALFAKYAGDFERELQEQNPPRPVSFDEVLRQHAPGEPMPTGDVPAEYQQ